ncbi:MAG: hypothetical protein WCO06_01310 [Candidatus Roizmanbacteria bacterium]
MNINLSNIPIETLTRLESQAQSLGLPNLNSLVYFLLINMSHGRVKIDLQSDEYIEEIYKTLKKINDPFANTDLIYNTLGKEGSVIVPEDLYANSYDQILESTKQYVNQMYEGIITETREAFFHIHWLQQKNWENHRDSYRYYCDLYGLSLAQNNSVAIMSYKQQGYDVALYASAYPKYNFKSVELTKTGVEKSTELLTYILKLTNTTIQEGNGTELLSSYNNNSLGAIIGNWTLGIAQDPIQKIILMHKKLAQNGILVLTESTGMSHPYQLYNQRGLLHIWEKRMNNYVLKVYFRDLEKTLIQLGFKIILNTLDNSELHDTVIAIKTDSNPKKISLDSLMDTMRPTMLAIREQLMMKLSL